MIASWAFIAAPVAAQSALVDVNDNTTVRNISYRFVDTRTFEPDRLNEHIATRSPTLLDRAQNTLPLLSGRIYPFSPLELERDVKRLERFYARRGFPEADIDYPASQFDAETNTIHIIFTIYEGRPVTVETVNFFGPDTTGQAAEQFDAEIREEWRAFRDNVRMEQGVRYSENEVLAVENEVLRWMKNRGYAFAEIESDVVVDTVDLSAEVNFLTDPGPRARISEIQIDGNDSVSERVIRREIPQREGDWYHHDRLVRGQRQLFGLNMFRVALLDVPEQPRGNTVRVRYELREGNLRYLSANTGYGRNSGLTGEGRWMHRNFLGAGRDFTVSGLANTGIFSAAQDRIIEDRRFRTAVTLRQPYAGHRQLSATISPFLEFQSNPLLAVSDQPFGVNAREFGVSSTLLYEILPFRTISLQHTFARALRFTEMTDPEAAPDEQLQELRDLYDRSTISLNAQLGRTDDFVAPNEGFLVQPSVDFGKRFFGSELEFLRVSSEFTGYLPLDNRMRLSGRVYMGRIWPLGITAAHLRGEAGTPTEIRRTESRFQLSRFYAGGGNDLRGWAQQMAGDKRVRRLVTVFGDATRDTTFTYEPEGGTIRLGYNAELRLPMPVLGSAWRTAIFFDAGHVGDELALDNFRYGAGAGIRYITPVGHVRLDIAGKINPDAQDMRNPAEYFRQGADADPRWWRRFRIHLSIGQAF